MQVRYARVRSTNILLASWAELSSDLGRKSIVWKNFSFQSESPDDQPTDRRAAAAAGWNCASGSDLGGQLSLFLNPASPFWRNGWLSGLLIFLKKKGGCYLYLFCSAQRQRQWRSDDWRWLILGGWNEISKWRSKQNWNFCNYHISLLIETTQLFFSLLPVIFCFWNNYIKHLAKMQKENGRRTDTE